VARRGAHPPAAAAVPAPAGAVRLLVLQLSLRRDLDGRVSPRPAAGEGDGRVWQRPLRGLVRGVASWA